MYLKKTPAKDGRVFLSIVKSFREDGKVKQRTVESLGYLDELSKEYDDPIGYFTERAKVMTEDEKRKAVPVPHVTRPGRRRKASSHEMRAKNLGAAVPLAYYNSLGIEKVLRNACRTRRVSYDVNAVMRLLVIERLIAPGSKLAAWNRRDTHFFRCDFTDDDLYRALGIIADARDNIVSATSRSVAKMIDRRISPVFYGVTNYHFETDGEYELRRKDMAREHASKPIIRMGLLQDADAIPLTYRLFLDDTPDSAAMFGVLSDMKRDFSLDRVVVVADEELNRSETIAACVDRKDGFIFFQSMLDAEMDTDLRNWVLSEEGYTHSGEGGGFKRKSRQGIKTVTIKADVDGQEEIRDVDVDVKFVAFWSHKSEQRARQDRAKTISKARELVTDPSACNRATHYDAARYVSNITFDEKTGKVVDNGLSPTFDEAALAADEACDGFYCIITSETDMQDDEIIDAYRGLLRSEESLKITKTDLITRPIYVSKQAHIEAHFLICYIALLIIRLMQHAMGNTHPARAIIDALCDLEATSLEDNWWVIASGNPFTDELFALVGLPAPSQYMKLAEIKKLFSKQQDSS